MRFAFWRKKKEGSGSKAAQDNLRRRFHHTLLEKRRTGAAHSFSVARPRRPVRLRATSPFPPLFKKIFLITSAVLSIGAVTYIVFFSGIFDISKIVLEKEGSAVSPQRLQPFLDELKGSNIVFATTDQIARTIEKEFSNEILLVKIKKNYPNKLIFKVQEYPTVLNLQIQSTQGNKEFILNQIGYSIAENKLIKELPLLLLDIKTSALPMPGIIIPKEKLTTMVEAFKKFTDLFGMKITQGVWQKTERELHLLTERGFSVWLDLTSDVVQQLNKLKRALKKLDIYKESLDYIDLRIAGAENEKVVFKRK